jgi:hypothetical protein
VTVIVPARPVEPDELPRNAASLIKDATKRRWLVTATYAEGQLPVTIMAEDVGAPPTPTGRVARKQITETRPVSSVVVKLASPFGDRAIFAWTGDNAEAWISPRASGHATSVGYLAARRFVLGPWGDDMPVPSWRRDKIADAKRLAKPGICTGCGAAVLHGIDQLDGVAAVADAEPIEGPLAHLTEIAFFLSGRDVYTAMPAGGGLELHRREDWHLGDRRWPVHAAHRCNQETAS